MSRQQLQAVSEAREAVERMGQALTTDGAVIVPQRALEALRRKAALADIPAWKPAPGETLEAVIIGWREADGPFGLQWQALTQKATDGAMQGLHHVRRKRVYERLFPEVKAGTAQAQAMNGKLGRSSCNVADKLSARSYAADAANATGESERTVRRKTRIGEALEPIAEKRRREKKSNGQVVRLVR